MMSEAGASAAARVDEMLPMSSEAAVESSDPRRTVIALCILLAYQGFTMAINGIGAPWIAKSFNLTETGIATLYAWVSLSAIGALVLSRMADRVGRQRVLFWCMLATPLAALGAAISSSQVMFVCFDIIVYACIGATVATAVVMLAEELPIAARARGQSFGGLAVGLGNGVCVVLMPLLVDSGYSWRWLLGLAGVGLFVTPFVARRIPESHRWVRVAASGRARASRFYDVFTGNYRRRALPMLACFLFGTIAATATTSWGYYHAVSVVGLSAGAASVMTLVGGGVSMLGFPLGAWSANRFGRVPTVVFFGLLTAVGALLFYWGPPASCSVPAVWLAASFAWFMATINASTVAGNAAATELFPTALRGAMIGWFALIGAVAAVTSQAVIAVLATPLGGLSVVVGYLGLLVIPSAIVFGACVDETKGMSLELASGELD